MGALSAAWDVRPDPDFLGCSLHLQTRTSQLADCSYSENNKQPTRQVAGRILTTLAAPAWSKGQFGLCFLSQPGGCHCNKFTLTNLSSEVQV